MSFKIIDTVRNCFVKTTGCGLPFKFLTLVLSFFYLAFDQLLLFLIIPSLPSQFQKLFNEVGKCAEKCLAEASKFGEVSSTARDCVAFCLHRLIVGFGRLSLAAMSWIDFVWHSNRLKTVICIPRIAVVGYVFVVGAISIALYVFCSYVLLS